MDNRRATFVTTLAWIFIVLGGFATIISILQNAVLALVFAPEQFEQSAATVPGILGSIFSNVRWFFLMFLVVSAFSFISAIGLLKRKHWARIAFIILMAFGIAWSILGVIVQLVVFSSLPSGTPSSGEEQLVMYLIQVVSVIFALAFALLFAWIIKKLASSNIRAEFPL